MAEAPLPKTDPLIVAWEAYKASQEYANTRRWALHQEHVDGSLWASFVAGYKAAQAEPQEPLPYGFESGLVQLLNEARCLEGRVVGNRELASRIVGYIRRGIGKQESK